MFTTPEAVKRIRSKVSSGEEKKQQLKPRKKRERKKSPIKKPQKTSLGEFVLPRITCALWLNCNIGTS